jgi:hypothetical protein
MKGIAMERYISTTARKFSNLLGIIGRMSLVVSGLAIPGFVLSSLKRSLGLRHGGGSTRAGSHVPVRLRVSLALAGATPAPVHQITGKQVSHCWRPARLAWRDSGKNNV